ncbi:MAG: glucose-6-phosphate dehydrogenase [Thermoplasmata archaeon]|nr:glucose-6-phosphate dehydrogenase [Thermoplasmata archaeon]
MGPPELARHLLVVFGATGDLMQRKLLPALHSVAPVGDAPFVVVGVARQPLDEPGFRAQCVASLTSDGSVPTGDAAAWAARHLHYVSVGAGAPEDYQRLSGELERIEREEALPGNRVLYLALPAAAFPPTIEGLGSAGLHRSKGWTRLVVEKPFGRDLASARALNALVHQFFAETQVYRIDHYLGKETVQNLLVFRFANMLFESAWNRDRVDCVEITVAEDLGVEHRAGYYETAGALRDMVQNHLMQLLTLTAMAVPAQYEADQIRNEKVKVLRSLEAIRPEEAVFGQYGPGTVGAAAVPGYREEPGVNPTSTTETYVALRLKINNFRWQGVPFFLRTGKRLPTKTTYIHVHFRSPPVWFFPATSPGEITANSLRIMVQPDEGFELAIEVKKPGHEIALQTQRMHFQYSEVFGPLADAYQTLILDVMRGDQTLFVRADEVEESWRLIAPLLEHPPALRPYPAGAWGPTESTALVTPGGHHWTEG